MPFRSKAQRRKFAELLVNGKITDEAYERWNQTTGRRELPERLHPEKKEAGKRTAKKMTKKKTAKKTAKKKCPALRARSRARGAEVVVPERPRRDRTPWTPRIADLQLTLQRRQRA